MDNPSDKLPTKEIDPFHRKNSASEKAFDSQPKTVYCETDCTKEGCNNWCMKTKGHTGKPNCSLHGEF